jgi:alkaline phosphatase
MRRGDTLGVPTILHQGGPMIHRLFALALLAVLATGCASVPSSTGSVIFYHPDGTSTTNWAVARAYLAGPDGQLNWDKLPAMAVYTGHMADAVTATSNGGATTHAYGVKVASDAYGTWGSPGHPPIVDRNGKSMSIAHQALDAGLPVGLVQTGTSTEPGTGCFVASVPSRKQHEDIAAQLIDSGCDIMLGGGEMFYLPKGVQGRHGMGVREDGRNLIDEARKAGYTVVFTADELAAVPDTTDKLLGLFAEYHTFNDKPEEVLAAEGLPMYEPDAPSVAQMSDKALQLLSRKGKRFLLIVEEEGTDNFGNNGNAPGMLEALRRADEAYGVMRKFVAKHRDTLLITAADSDGGGMRMRAIRVAPGESVPDKLPATDKTGAPIDGVAGTGTAPFYSAPDKAGKRHPFLVIWPGYSDVSGGILVRAEGLNSIRVHGMMDNTDIPKLMYRTLFGKPAPAAAPRP